MRRWLVGATVALIIGVFASPWSGYAASSSADPAFQTQWQQGEAITPNFWGPLATAHDGQQEPYKEAQGGQRLVQYFDKGRMELTNGTVTNGLLATEIIKGQIQTGDATFQGQPSPAIPIAGDPDNPGPTYSQLGAKAKGLFDAAPQQTGNYTQAAVSSSGDISVSNAGSAPYATFTVYDSTTKHNVPKAFADYRMKAGLLTIGLALCDPFYTTVKVGGQSKQVMVQVFERRVLTYTDSNPDAFKVEMGNIGQHYYKWRYSGPSPAPTTTTAPVAIPSPSVQPAPTSAPKNVQTFSGSGTKVTQKFQLNPGMVVFRSVSKAGQDNFIAELKDTQGNDVALAANEIGPSTSSRVTGLKQAGTFFLAVQYDGTWTIEVDNPGNALDNPISAPTTLSGTGTVASRALNLQKGLLTVTYTSKGSDNFIATLYDSNGSDVGLGANEIGNSSGSRAIRVPADGTYVFNVLFDGQWTLTLSQG